MTIGIRFPELSDREAFIKAMRASECLHYPWVDPPKTSEAFNAFMEKYRAENNISYFVMDESQIAGVINMNEIVRGCFQSTFLGYYTVAAFAGKGVMTKGLKLVLEKAFNEHGLHRLEANIQPENTASIRLVEKCGFVNEGFSKNYLKINGQWRDHERWAITQEIYNQSHKT